MYIDRDLAEFILYKLEHLLELLFRSLPEELLAEEIGDLMHH